MKRNWPHCHDTMLFLSSTARHGQLRDGVQQLDIEIRADLHTGEVDRILLRPKEM